MEKIKYWFSNIWYWIKELRTLWLVLAFGLIGFIISEGLSDLINEFRH